MKLGIQMFNFVKGGDWGQVQTTEDVGRLLEQIAEAGFDGVEWLSFMLEKEGLDLEAIKRNMDRLGLETCSMHYHCWDPASMEETCKAAADRCRLFDSKYLTFAFSTPDLFGIQPLEPEEKALPEADASGNKKPPKQPEEKKIYTPEQIDLWAKRADEVLDCLRGQVQGSDIQVLYHNHADEFRKGSDGRYFLDLIHPQAQEVDVYWAAKGMDGKVSTALAYIRSIKDRVAMLHMKDGLNGSLCTGEMCGWGKGTYPLQEVVDCGKELGLTWVVAENDNPQNFGTTGVQDARETGAYAAQHITM